VHIHATYVAKWIFINMSKLKIAPAIKFKTPEEARIFLRKVMGPPYRTLEGQEYEEARLMLAFLQPCEQSNNQHSWTDCYKVGDIEYRVTTWPSEHKPTIDEYLPENT
jgi:hypothetical protein